MNFPWIYRSKIYRDLFDHFNSPHILFSNVSGIHENLFGRQSTIIHVPYYLSSFPPIPRSATIFHALSTLIIASLLKIHAPCTRQTNLERDEISGAGIFISPRFVAPTINLDDSREKKKKNSVEKRHDSQHCYKFL